MSQQQDLKGKNAIVTGGGKVSLAAKQARILAPSQETEVGPSPVWPV